MKESKVAIMWESDRFLAPPSDVTYFGGPNDLMPTLRRFVAIIDILDFSAQEAVMQDESSKSPPFPYPQTYPQSAIMYNFFVQCSCAYPLFYPGFCIPRYEGRQCSDNSNTELIFMKSNRQISGEAVIQRHRIALLCFRQFLGTSFNNEAGCFKYTSSVFSILLLTLYHFHFTSSFTLPFPIRCHVTLAVFRIPLSKQIKNSKLTIREQVAARPSEGS